MAEELEASTAGSGTLGRAASGSATSLDELYRHHAPEARRLAYLLTGDHAAAEDIAHDAFVKLGSRIFALRSPEASRAYVRKTVVNTVVSRSRSRRREDARIDAHARADDRTDHRGGADAVWSEGDEVSDGLWEALLGLPPRQRAAIVLRHWLDLSEARTAELLGCGTGTVKSLVSRGLATLREAMTDV